MNTIIKKINPDTMTSEDFKEAAELLRNGRLVAFPTETVYGLGGDAYDKTAAARIYAAKGRPSDNPLIVHIAEISEMETLATEIPPTAYALAERFWPGPLTMILNKKDVIPRETTGGLDTVAIRMPSHPVARRLIKEAGLPIAAPSANASGRPSTTRAEHVIEDLEGKIDMIIDGGSSDIGLESTIVDLTCEPALILRPGYINLDMLREIIPDITFDKAVVKRTRDDSIVAKAPGMKYKHYAPKGDLSIYEGEAEAVIKAINTAAEAKAAAGYKVGILASREYADQYTTGLIEIVGARNDEESIAAKLFDVLRDFDRQQVEYIYAESFESDNLGQAIMNRLLKAAGYQINEC